MQPRHYLFAACVFVITLSVLILTSRPDVAEPFSVVGGSVDTRLALLGSTDHSANTVGTWINVATFANTAPNQSHALTLEVYPHSSSAGGSRQTFFVLAQNGASGPDPSPIVLQKNLWDSSNWAKPTFTGGSLVLTTSTSSGLNNVYNFYLQLGVPNAFNIPAEWFLSDFQTTDTVAVGDVTPSAALPTGVAVYNLTNNSYSVPKGLIAMWSGPTVPTGWVVCDGTNGTPDLRGQFVMGTSANHALGSTGGEEQHTLSSNEMPSHSHTVNDPGHAHGVSGSVAQPNLSGPAWSSAPGNGPNYNLTTNRSTTGITTQSMGGGSAHNNLPPFVVLYYIMKT